MNGDSISLRHVRPDRIEPAVPAIVTQKSFYYNKVHQQLLQLTEPNHGRSTGDTVKI